MPGGAIALIIISAIIVGAVTTRRCVEFLFLGSFLGAIALFGVNALPEWCGTLVSVTADNAWLWLVCGLFGSLIALLQASKGTFGFSSIISRLCRTQHQTLFTAFVMGLLLFIDDYLNVMTIGVCMKDISDERKIPREALAFILNSTGAPVCVLLPFSTWAAFYADLFYKQPSVAAQFPSGMDAYIHAIPFCFYPIIGVIIVGLFACGVVPKLGAMKRAYRRVEETGMVYSAQSRKYNVENSAGQVTAGNCWNFILPILILILVGIATGDILAAVIVSIVVCLVMYVPQKLMSLEQFLDLMIQGFGDMLVVFFMLVAAFSLERMCSGLGLTEFLVELIRPIMSVHLFPAVSFLLLGILAFVTGSNWGMSAVVIPILIPACAALDANIILTMAAIISGGVFGSHACFYTDATILTAKSTGISNLEHALSQFPYVVITALLSTTAFLIAGFMM